MATIFLTPGDDARTIVNPGSYTIDALGGVDSLSFGTSLRSVYTITTTADGAVQVDTVSGASAPFHATLYNTEVLLFDNERDRLEVSSLFGHSGSTLTGSEGNDSFVPDLSITAIEGRGGIDTVVFEMPRDAVTLRPTSNGFAVDRSNGSGSWALQDVERLRFDDLWLALDLNGNAGTVARTLGAVFGPEAVANPVFAGIGLLLSDSGMDAATLMRTALDARLGPDASSAEIVTLLYTNVVGIAPSADVLASFVALLDEQAFTPEALGLAAAETTLNLDRIDFTGLASFGLVYEPQLAG
jgi:hypothetical protein